MLSKVEALLYIFLAFIGAMSLGIAFFSYQANFHEIAVGAIFIFFGALMGGLATLIFTTFNSLP